MNDELKLKCPSGATLKIHSASFSDAKTLYQAVLRKLGAVEINSSLELITMYKNLFSVGFSCPEIEAALWECLKRCTYDSNGADLKISVDTFEPLPARKDYIFICTEVAKRNISPFANGLYAEFQRVLATTTPENPL